MSDSKTISPVDGKLSLADSKLLVRSLKAIDADNVQLEAFGCMLYARASGAHAVAEKLPCVRHEKHSVKCQASGTYKDLHGREQPGCRSRSHVWCAEMSLSFDVFGGQNIAPRYATVSLKTLAGVVKASSKLKVRAIELHTLGGVQWK